MKLRRSRRSKRGRIEILPMIDVMFFLLATFMLTSLAMQRLDAVRINLPQGRAQQMTQDKPLTLSVNEANQVFINQQAVRLDPKLVCAWMGSGTSHPRQRAAITPLQPSARKLRLLT